MNKPKIIVILGPTATGKSDLAVELAKTFNGEIISADSRQVYKGLNIGSGKITKREMEGIPHHLLDVISPKNTFSVVQFKKKSEKIISDILKRNKIPIICGGTGFYIQSIVDGIILPEIKINKELRKKLEKQNTERLFKMLVKLDPKRASEIDNKNPVRLIRAIEIATTLGSVPKVKKDSKYNVLQIGLDWSDDILKKRIHDRLLKRMRGNKMIKEVEDLHKKDKVSWKRLEALGLEYRYVALYLQNKINIKENKENKENKEKNNKNNKNNKEEMLKKLETEIWRFAKRQRTWFKRDKQIKWFKPTEIKKILEGVKEFVK